MESSAPQSSPQSMPKDPEDFDQSIDVIRRPTQLWIYSLLGVGTLAFAWSVLGSIKIEETAPSIFVPEGSVAFARSKAQLGVVESIDVKIGDSVKKGQIVASLQVPSGLVDVNNAMEELEFQKEVEAMKLKSEIDRLIDQIETSKNLLDVYSSRVKDAKLLVDKKIIAKDQYNNMLEKKLSLQNNLKASQSQLAQARIRRDESIAQKTQLHARALDRLGVQKYVTSPYDGTVIAIGTRIGESLGNGSPVIQIAKGGISKSLKHVAFFSVDKGKKINKGMDALVTPSSVEREEFGSIKGIVSDVSLYPISKERIRSVVGDEATVEQMSRGPVIEVQIELRHDSESYSGYSWTSGKGPAISITPGLSATSYVVTEVKKPISYAIPWIKNQVIGNPIDEIKQQNKSN